MLTKVVITHLCVRTGKTRDEVAARLNQRASLIALAWTTLTSVERNVALREVALVEERTVPESTLAMFSAGHNRSFNPGKAKLGEVLSPGMEAMRLCVVRAMRTDMRNVWARLKDVLSAEEKYVIFSAPNALLLKEATATAAAEAAGDAV